MPKRLNLDLNEKELELLDKRRGDLSREEFLMKMLDEQAVTPKTYSTLYY